jgi:hypothetical protein
VLKDFLPQISAGALQGAGKSLRDFFSWTGITLSSEHHFVWFKAPSESFFIFYKSMMRVVYKVQLWKSDLLLHPLKIP